MQRRHDRHWAFGVGRSVRARRPNPRRRTPPYHQSAVGACGLPLGEAVPPSLGWPAAPPAPLPATPPAPDDIPPVDPDWDSSGRLQPASPANMPSAIASAAALAVQWRSVI